MSETLDLDVVARLCAELSILRFFPTDGPAQLGVMLLIGRMANTEDEVRWLVHRTLALYNEWPGPMELRAIFCSRFTPKDGYKAYSAVYPFGIPSEKQIEQPAPLQLPDGHVASIDPELERAVRELAAAKDRIAKLEAQPMPHPIVLKAVRKEDFSKREDPAQVSEPSEGDMTKFSGKTFDWFEKMPDGTINMIASEQKLLRELGAA